MGEEEVGVELGVEEELERELERRRRTPSGRRTPLCGRHRHRHKSGKSSTGSSPAPSHRNELRQPSSPVPPPPAFDDGGYEPVGQPHSDRLETRSPHSGHRGGGKVSFKRQEAEEEQQGRSKPVVGF